MEQLDVSTEIQIFTFRSFDKCCEYIKSNEQFQISFFTDQ